MPQHAVYLLCSCNCCSELSAQIWKESFQLLPYFISVHNHTVAIAAVTVFNMMISALKIILTCKNEGM